MFIPYFLQVFLKERHRELGAGDVFELSWCQICRDLSSPEVMLKCKTTDYLLHVSCQISNKNPSPRDTKVP